MEITCRLKEVLKDIGMTQTFLASKVGVSRQCIRSWYLGLTVPDLGDAYKVAELVRKDVTDIWVYTTKEEK